jgi:hypothetical protein
MSTAVQTKTAQELVSELYNKDIYNKQLVKENAELKRQVDVLQLTLRDKFASRAMQGVLVNSGRNGFEPDDTQKIVNFAYALADAMVKARYCQPTKLQLDDAALAGVV